MTQGQPGVPAPATQASVQHIIQAGSGGRWWRDDLICKQCNDRLGSEVDTHLVEWARPLTTFLMVRHGRTGARSTSDFTVNGKAYRLNAQTARTTTRKIEPNPAALEINGPLGSERYLKKSLKNMARGRDLTTLGQPILRYEDEPAPKVPIELDWQFRDVGVRRAVAKIAYLGAAALLGQAAFARVSHEALRRAVRGKEAPNLVVVPLGAMGLRRMGHGVSLHLLPDGRLGALVTLFGVLPVLVPLGEVAGTLPSPLSAVVVWPRSRDEAVHHTVSPELPLTLDSHPELLPSFLREALEQHESEVQAQGAVHRAWDNSGLTGKPWPGSACWT